MFPHLFTIGSFSVPTYGVLVALGLVIGLYVAGKLAERSGLDPERITNLGVYIAFAAIIGAKLFMIVADPGYYLGEPSHIFSISFLRAGGIFYGGLLAALGTAIWYSRKAGLPALETADVFAPAVALGHSVGRMGCFAAGCCWGKPSDLPWAVVFTDPQAHNFVGVPLNIHLHPTQIYESLGTLVIGLILLRVFFKPHRSGTVIGLYLVLYSSFRFGVEFLRDSSEFRFPFNGPFSTTQWVALGLIVAGIAVLARRERADVGAAVGQPG